MKVEEIRSLLVQAGCSLEMVNNIKGKVALEDALAQVNGNLALAQPDVPTRSAEPLVKPEPEMGSPEWTDHVLGLLRATELVNGSPTCAGLRRVSQLLLGDILSSKPVYTNIMNTENGLSSTVGFEVTFLWKRPICIESDLSNPLPYITRTYGDVSDCNEGNTGKPYSLHPSATASSRSEARCLRKALLLNVISAEELNSNYVKDVDMGNFDSDKVSDTQMVFIEFKCRQLGIDMNKFIAENSEGKPLNEIPRDRAVHLIKLLNSYQFDTNNSESKEIPDSIKL